MLVVFANKLDGREVRLLPWRYYHERSNIKSIKYRENVKTKVGKTVEI